MTDNALAPPSRVATAQSPLPSGHQSLHKLLPQLSHASIACHNRTYAAPVARLSDGKSLVWQGIGPIAMSSELHCRLAGQSFTLAADNLAVLEPRLKGFESFVPSEACAALVEHALAPVLELLERLAGGPVECNEYKRVDTQDQPRMSSVAHRDGDEPVRIGFILRDAGLQPLASGWMNAMPSLWQLLDFSRTPEAPSARHRAVPVTLSVQLGRCGLLLAELRDLAVGDALRISPRIRNTSPLQGLQSLPVRLVAGSGRQSCRARLTGDQIVLETTMNDTMDINASHPLSSLRTPSPGATSRAQGAGSLPGMPMPHLASSPGGSAGDFLSDVECELTFELGSMRLTVAEIAKLRVGQSLRMGAHLQEQPIRILAGGRQIARGELAAVGQELVVVVTQTQGLPDI